MDINGISKGYQPVPRNQQNSSVKPPQNLESKNTNVKIDKVDINYIGSPAWIQKVLSSEIGIKVEAMLGAAGINLADYSGIDWSPEATAQRIFSFTTGMYGMYKSQHPDMSEEEAVAGFESLVRSSVREGFEEAMGILQASGLDNSATAVARETISILDSKFDTFFSDLKEAV